MPSLWLNLARSGGTLLSRCLGCMDGVMLLSEVHPLGVRVIDPGEQAARWHKLLTSAELRHWAAGRLRYDALIETLDARAQARGKTLLLRDWSHLDFLGVPFTEPSFESRSSLLLAGLRPTRFATVRHPMDQWLSQQRLDVLRDRVELAVYLRGCRAFAELAASVGFAKYEDFTLEPDGVLRRLCEGLGVPFDPAWWENFQRYDRVTGDAETTARAVGPIRPARRREPEPALRDHFQASEDYQETCRVLGYSP
ncbi:MAG: hypothetical protein IPJ41_03725 [Phycisphaerales bacterium]|nr:hypothetical protein [Phycisphaerales bacterium]